VNYFFLNDRRGMEGRIIFIRIFLKTWMAFLNDSSRIMGRVSNVLFVPFHELFFSFRSGLSNLFVQLEPEEKKVPSMNGE
jgi:hypothetical protein